MCEIILGSGSPRRNEIMTLAGIKHTVIVPSADESSVQYKGDCVRYVKELAKLKSDALLKIHNVRDIAKLHETVTVCADTVVFSPKYPQPLGKPKSFDEACSMLKLLSGTFHYVLTGVCLRYGESLGEEHIFCEQTKVHFRELTDGEIESYVGETNPYDKAGAYGIQDRACAFVSGIEGDYYNVVGLPICSIVKFLKYAIN